jgi:hypothetical protein
MNEIYPCTNIKTGEDCPKALMRIPVWRRGKSGKSPGKKHKRVIKDLERIKRPALVAQCVKGLFPR